MKSAREEIDAGDRFAFGANWQEFLKELNDDRIRIAEDSLRELLQEESIEGKTFLDIGSGSGLFSLCARRLGAKVHSFDFDPQSVACTNELRNRYFPDDEEWTVEKGSALDQDYLKSLGTFDVVYSWGVLHHTGDMWQAIQNTLFVTNPGSKLAIAIYNDQGMRSGLWLKVKKIYCSGTFGRSLMSSIFFPYFALRMCLASVVRGRNEFASYRRHRGMSAVHDWIDWLGGLPFEVADPDEIRIFYETRSHELLQLKETCGLGCNQFLFQREA